MSSEITIGNIITIASILVAMALVPIASQFDFRFRLGRGKEPRDQASCGLFLLRTLRREINSNSHDSVTWSDLLRLTTIEINVATEGGNYSLRHKDHLTHMQQSRDRLVRLRAIRLCASGRLGMGSVGFKVLERVGERRSKDERDAAFEQFYSSEGIPEPITTRAIYREHLRLALPAPRPGHTIGEITVAIDFGQDYDCAFLYGLSLDNPPAFDNSDVQRRSSAMIYRYVKCYEDEDGASSFETVCHVDEIWHELDRAQPAESDTAARGHVISANRREELIMLEQKARTLVLTSAADWWTAQEVSPALEIDSDSVSVDTWLVLATPPPTTTH